MSGKAAKDLGDAVENLKIEQGLMQFDIGERNHGLLVGPTFYIVTDNDFCYQVRSLNENIELESNYSWKHEGRQEFKLLTLPEIRAIARPVTSYREWAHYWGIKPRIAHNYSDMTKHARDMGADTSTLPEWGEEPIADESAKRPISDQKADGPASKKE